MYHILFNIWLKGRHEWHAMKQFINCSVTKKNQKCIIIAFEYYLDCTQYFLNVCVTIRYFYICYNSIIVFLLFRDTYIARFSCKQMVDSYVYTWWLSEETFWEFFDFTCKSRLLIARYPGKKKRNSKNRRSALFPPTHQSLNIRIYRVLLIFPIKNPDI